MPCPKAINGNPTDALPNCIDCKKNYSIGEDTSICWNKNKGDKNDEYYYDDRDPDNPILRKCHPWFYKEEGYYSKKMKGNAMSVITLTCSSGKLIKLIIVESAILPLINYTIMREKT